MFKSTCLLSLLFSTGVVLSDKCIVVDPTSRYPVPDPTSASSSAPVPYPTPPTPSLTRDSCIQIASQLQFVKGGELNSGNDGVNLDLGQAGQAQQTNNPFAKSLRKESAGFSLPFNAIPGTPIKTFSPLTPGMVVNTDDYQINFIYSQVGRKIENVKCHYKDEDIDSGDKTSTSTSSPSSSPTPPAPNDEIKECIKIANQLQFVKGGQIRGENDGVNLDIGQAGAAQQSNNPFAKSLRKESAGFSLPFSAIPGKPISTFSPLTPGMVVNTDKPEINFIYSQVGSTIIDVKCHYKDKDIDSDDKPTSTSSTQVPSPTSPLNRDSCIQIASQLQFVKGGELNSGNDGVNLDLGQAGQAQQTNNTFAKSLRKESAGFSLPFSAVPGTPIKTFSPLTPGMVVNTDDYQINFIYSQVGRKIENVKCHYQQSDL